MGIFAPHIIKEGRNEGRKDGSKEDGLKEERERESKGGGSCSL